MSSCGVYSDSGEWLFSLGVPAKSAASGAIMVVIPNVMGICTWAPRLGKTGLSVQGMQFLKMLTTEYAFHTYDKVARSQNVDPCLYHGTNEIFNIAQLCYAVTVGDANDMRRILSHSVPVNGTDYDGRTALHIAVSENQEKVVQFLIL